MNASTGRVSTPERLRSHHDLLSFHNGRHTSLDEWLRNRALASEGLSARTYVVCAGDAPNRVVAYYAISTAMEQRIALPRARLRRGMPEQVPLLLIGRLAIDEEAASFYQHHGFSVSPLGERIMLMPIETVRALLR